MANGLHGKNLAQSETLCTWRSSLHGTWEVSRRRQTHDGADEGGLAHAVAAKQRDDLAGADVQRNAANDDRLAIATVKVANLKHDAAFRDRLPEPWRCGECLPAALPPGCGLRTCR